MAPEATSIGPTIVSHTDPANPPSQRNFDVLVVGAGISGINAGYRIQSGLPHMSYAILEARDNLGGTWDLFKYPGIRSDSDLHTFGFPWEPWTDPQTIAEGDKILAYMNTTASKYGIDRHIRYRHRMTSLDWHTDEQRWRVNIKLNNSDAPLDQVTYRARFIILSTGYYDYQTPLKAPIPGIENFKGKVIHPQFWPTDFDYTNKRVVVIGSGATAVTLIPNLSDRAKHVTMVQRSPGYLINLPRCDPSVGFLRKFLPKSIVYQFTRLRWLVLPLLFFNFCRSFPNAARKALRKRTQDMLPSTVAHDPHFNPSYNPWEQRLCVTPDGDFFDCLKGGKAEVATGTIKNVSETGLLLDGAEKEIPADVIVTATGLKLQSGGGSSFSVDGKPTTPGQKFLWNGMMLQDIPNAAYVIGYTNASWTLGADATAQGFVRLIKIMESKGYTSMIPRVPESKHMDSMPLVDFKSTYFKKGNDVMPKAGDQAPWRRRTNYFRDLWAVTFGANDRDLEFHTVKTS